LKNEADSQIRPDRVAIYIRWSTEEQGDGTTLAEQREGSELYVRSQGWFVNPDLVFIDDGYSGGTLDRPAMSQLRELVRKSQVDCVVVFKIDRLSRNIVDATQLVLVEWKDKCHLRCVRQPIDTTSETGRMIFSILATFADFERAQIRERTFSGRVRRLKEGKAYGGPQVPFGLMATGEPGVRALDPEKAPIVAEMFRKVREERASVMDLAQWLDSLGIAPPVGKMWRYNSLRHMLSNPIYAGRIVYGREDGKRLADRRHRPVRKGTPLVDVQAVTVPAIVPPEVFEEVQAIIADRCAFHKRTKRASDGVHLLSGIAKCRCGGGIQVHYSRGAKYYICSHRINYGPKGCPAENGVVLAEKVEAAVVNDLLDVYGGVHKREQAASQVFAQSSVETKTVQREMGKVKAELQKTEKRLSELRAAASVGDLTLVEWRELRAAIEERQAEIVKRRDELQARLDRVSQQRADEQLMLDRLAQLDRWNEMTPPQQKELLRELAERIELFKPKGHRQPYQVHITWRFMTPDQTTPYIPADTENAL